MLGIYARSFMTATRNAAPLHPAPTVPASKRRWLPAGHWWLEPQHDRNPKDATDQTAGR